MRAPVALAACLVGLLLATPASAGDNEASLFDGAGEAIGYLVIDEDLTIYLWSGRPVAYLAAADYAEFHVYGFNGKHLGWFLEGVIWDHYGDAACAVKEKMRSTHPEPFKSFKQFKPFKAFKEYAPPRPALSDQFGDIPCEVLLAFGMD